METEFNDDAYNVFVTVDGENTHVQYDIPDTQLDDFFDEEEWEDAAAVKAIKEKLPGWKIMKIGYFHNPRIKEIEEWCSSTCQDEWKRIGWSSGCSTTVGVAFKNIQDAIYYKLRWAEQ